MKKIGKLLVCLLCIAVSLSSLIGCDDDHYYKETALPHFDYSDGNGKSYNTELFYMNDFDVTLGDPTVFSQVEEDGETWFYITGTVSAYDFSLWKTKDFTTFEDLGVVFDPPVDFYGVHGFYAPQLFFDEEADWQYYLGEDAGEGKGLYVLFFSARTTVASLGGPHKIGCAFSKNVEGPYVNFEGTNADGDYKDPSVAVFELDKLKDSGLGEGTKHGPLYKEGRSFIDAFAYIDPITGDKYLYMCRNFVADSSSVIWGVKMKDWVTPIYETTTVLTSHGYTTVDETEKYGYQAPRNKIDEGPFIYYKDITDDGIDNGTYYLTLSIGDTNDKWYPVCQALGDSPLGPFTKVQPEDQGLIIMPSNDVDIHCVGHHAFFELEGELYIAYHTYMITETNAIKSRYFAFDRVEWAFNDKGQYLMHANGPTKTIQPLPFGASGYENVAEYAKVSVSGSKSDPKLLNDNIMPQSDEDTIKEFTAKGTVDITLSFDEYVTARAILIYNSYDYSKIFKKIERIEFTYVEEVNGEKRTGIAYIDNLGFNLDHYLVPKTYLGFFGDDVLTEEDKVIRPCSAAIAEFDELKINKVKITVKKGSGKTALNLSEIVILGNKTA